MKPTIFLLTLTSCAALSAAPVSPTKAAETMDVYLQEWTAQDMFSGVALVAQSGELVLHKSYGKSDLDGNIINTLNTRFRIASLTKAFTAMAVLQLEEQGLLSVNDPLSNYLPAYPHGDRITLDMLLNHRSGIVDHTTLPDFQTVRRNSVCSLEETIQRFKDLPLEFTPGSRFEYSNSNYILLGYIIEKVTQKPYAEVIHSRILEPLGMTHTGFEYYQRRPKDFAVGYQREGDRIVLANDRVMQNAHASGALYSTARDLYTWDRAFRGGQPLNKVALDKIRRSPHKEYAYGWAMTRVFGKKVWAHAGDTEGFKSWIMQFPDEDACVIVLSNFEHCLVDQVGMGLAAIVFGEPYVFPKRAVASKDVIANYDTYVGSYEVKPGFELNIIREGRQLFCQPTGQQRLELNPENGTTFFIREADAKIVFTRDAQGNLTSLTMRQSGRHISARRR